VKKGRRIAGKKERKKKGDGRGQERRHGWGGKKRGGMKMGMQQQN